MGKISKAVNFILTPLKGVYKLQDSQVDSSYEVVLRSADPQNENKLYTASITAVGGGNGNGDPFYYEVTYEELTTLISGNDLIPGALYKITDRGDLGLFFKAISINEISKHGERKMLCPAHYGQGNFDNYNWLGIWHADKNVVPAFNDSLTYTIEEAVDQSSATVIFLDAYGNTFNFGPAEVVIAGEQYDFVVDTRVYSILSDGLGGFTLENTVPGNGEIVSPTRSEDGLTITLNGQAEVSTFPAFVPESSDLTRCIWGGHVWKNVSGNIGTAIDNLTLSNDWEKITKNDFINEVAGTDGAYSPVQFEVIYDVVNDWIQEQRDGFGNITGVPSALLSPTFNPVDISDWNSSFTGGAVIIDNHTNLGFYNISGEGCFVSNNKCTSLYNIYILNNGTFTNNIVQTNINDIENYGVYSCFAAGINNIYNKGVLGNIKTNTIINNIPSSVFALDVTDITDYAFGTYSGYIDFSLSPLSNGSSKIVGYTWANENTVLGVKLNYSQTFIITDNNSATDTLDLSYAANTALSSTIDDLNTSVGTVNTGPLRNTDYNNGAIMITSTGGNITDGWLHWSIFSSDSNS